MRCDCSDILAFVYTHHACIVSARQYNGLLATANWVGERMEMRLTREDLLAEEEVVLVEELVRAAEVCDALLVSLLQDYD